MICIYDGKDYRGDFGNTSTFMYFQYVADTLNLEFLKSFLKLSTSINLREVIDEIESFVWPGGEDGIQAAADNIVKTLKSCRGIAFLCEPHGDPVVGEG